MANQRKAGVERVTLTIPGELLRAAEAEAERQGVDRLALMREAITAYVRPRAAAVGEQPATFGAAGPKARKAAASKNGRKS